MWKYKKTIARIMALPWQSLDEQGLLRLMMLSCMAAQEFAESLRIALGLYPDHQALRAMSRGELKTDNLRFGDYDRVGDHWEFLFYHLMAQPISDPPDIAEAAVRYLTSVRRLTPAVRAMSIFSRERELEAIFGRILSAGQQHWQSSGTLLAFHYYLQRHIALDSEDGGHADLLSGMPVDDRVDEFYQARLKLYEPIFPGLCSV